METIIPQPPADVSPMRTAFSRMVSKQWQAYVPQVLEECVPGICWEEIAQSGTCPRRPDASANTWSLPRLAVGESALWADEEPRKFCPTDTAERVVPLVSGAVPASAWASAEHARLSVADSDKGQGSPVISVADVDRRASEEPGKFCPPGTAERVVPLVFGAAPASPCAGNKFTKGRFIGEMYARACYSMLLVSATGPTSLRLLVQATALLPRSRVFTIRLGSALLAGMEQLLPSAVHRQIMLTSALMGMLDVVLDEAASAGEAEAVRISLLIAQPAPTPLRPNEQLIATLAYAARQGETGWQAEYWERVLQPSVSDYCRAEVLAVKQVPDATGMGHRRAGIDAAIKGMWYVVGPHMGLNREPSRFAQDQWNREQQWMADTSLLMQMIDDWVDQDEDRGIRLTPVATGDWTPQSVGDVYEKTVRDLEALLDESGVRNRVVKALFVDLYRDYLHTAMDAMRIGMAA